jgi:hypothetical protein
MGRPINKKYFGNNNLPDYANVSNKSGIGGEAVATITVSNSGTTYSQGATVTIGGGTIITGGSAATISSSINSAGNITVTKTGSGLGYTAAPSITVTPAATTTTSVSGNYTATTMTATSVTGIYLGMVIAGGSTGNNGRVQTITGPVAGVYTITSNVPNNGTFTNQTLTFTDAGTGFTSSIALAAPTTTQNAIAFTAFINAPGAAARANGDIIKQESTRRYLVDTTDGIGQVKLVTTDVLTAGTMKIIATDFGGATYFVKKLTARKAILVSRTNTSTALVSLVTDHDGKTTGVARWTFGAATGTTVTIANA